MVYRAMGRIKGKVQGMMGHMTGGWESASNGLNQPRPKDPEERVGRNSVRAEAGAIAGARAVGEATDRQ